MLYHQPHNPKKRHLADELSHKDNSPTNGQEGQGIDSGPSLQDNYSVKDPTWHYPPEFWDGLSEIPLVRGSLEELQRRIYTPPSFPSPPTELALNFTPAAYEKLARFSRHGGPDTSDLRDYPLPISNGRLPTTQTTPTMTEKKPSTTPYHPGFAQHLTDHAIYPNWKSQRPDLDDIRAALAGPRRPSLTPSMFSDAAFEAFQESNDCAKDEGDVLADVMPAIIGPRQADHPSSRNTLFGKLKPLTDGSLAQAKPDIYYGAYPEELDVSIRNELAHHIIPSAATDRPIVPNFFIEVKGPAGDLAVAKRQACHEGAIGSRAMHTLQNYKKEKPTYDGKPYTFTSTFHDGTLEIFAHHVTAPTSSKRQPEYHMTRVDTWGMTNTIDNFIRGATALRNARDLAKKYRDELIQNANARASQIRLATSKEEAPQPHHELSALDQPHESSPEHRVDLQDADSEPQQHIAETSHGDLKDAKKEAAVSQNLYTEDDSQEPRPEPAASSDNQPRSFDSGIAPGVSADPGRSKRKRQSPDPLSETSGSQGSKSRTRQIGR
ncbi:hypothetical protein IL306_006018 [Fusarium sp. DS 682]|nr:hypothetical protein IL306_006018 [Fusarium sp. DS 682]